jgi:hypothetical protein
MDISKFRVVTIYKKAIQDNLNNMEIFVIFELVVKNCNTMAKKG